MSDVVTDAAEDPVQARADLRDWFLLALLASAAIRILAWVLSGLIEWSRARETFGPAGKHRAGDIILRLTNFGDGVQALLLLAVAVLLYTQVWRRQAWFNGRPFALWTAAMAALTTVAALVGIIGHALLLSGQPGVASTMVGYVGSGLADALIAAVAAFASYRLTWSIDEQVLAAPIAEGEDPG
jgi:hypothetical protein